MGRGGLTPAQLDALTGDGARHDTAPDGVPRAAPVSAAGVARVLREASARGWRVRIEHDDWSPCDAAADLALSTRALTTVSALAPVDQVVTVGAGVALDRVRGSGVWCALDPPGRQRTVGGTLAAGGGGPLRAGYGAPRDQVLGLTAITGDGRTLVMGGRVMKNVAGYDLAKLFIGGFDAYGVIVSANLRLRATPRTDRTTLTTDRRDAQLERGLALLDGGAQPAAVELGQGVDGWTLAVRRHDATTDDGEVADAGYWARVTDDNPGAVTLRLGTLPDGVGRAFDLLDATLPAARRTSASLYPGVVRWWGDASADDVMRARTEAARHEMPLTVERAPWPVRAAVGVHGAFREGLAPLTAMLRHAFDPAGILVV